MECPACSKLMVIIEYAGVELDKCVSCSGSWFDEEELRHLFLAVGVPESLHDLEQRFRDLPHVHAKTPRRCPRCRLKMWHVAFEGSDGPVVIDRCPKDHGIWFDTHELRDILRAHLPDDSDALETVTEFLGRYVPKGSQEK